MTRTSRGLLQLAVGAAVCALVCAGGFAYVKWLAWSDENNPAAAPPKDLCAVVGVERIQRLVPDAEYDPKASYNTTDQYNGDATCEYGTGDSRSGYGNLTVRVLRQGQVSGKSGTDRAKDAFTDACKELDDGERELGDENCLAVMEGDTPSGQLRTRVGADLVYVDYYRHPGEVGDIRDGLVDVARAVLAGL